MTPTQPPEEWIEKIKKILVTTESAYGFSDQTVNELVDFIRQERELVRKEILNDLIEAAEPYEGSTWYNQLSIQTIKKVINSLHPQKGQNRNENLHFR